MRVSVVAVLVRLSMVVGLALAGADVWAQSASTAQVNGTVRDAGGLALPGVSIAMTQTDTGLTRTTVTDDSGSSTVTNFPVGPYRFEAMLLSDVYSNRIRQEPHDGEVLFASALATSSPVVNTVVPENACAWPNRCSSLCERSSLTRSCV